MGQHLLSPTWHPDRLHYSVLQLVSRSYLLISTYYWQSLTGSLAWFPTLFFTSVWVSEIYTSSVPSEGIDPKAFAADAVRAGNRALFLQALVVISVSIGAPFLVAESGVQVAFKQDGYAPLGDEGDAMGAGRGGASRKPSLDIRGAGGGFVGGAKDLASALVDRIKTRRMFELPIQGLTLVKVWSVSMFCFAIAMGMTWLVEPQSCEKVAR